MAKKLSAAVVAGQESVSAAVARVEQASLTLGKDHGIIESGVQALREKIDDLEDELAQTKETADRTIAEMKSRYEAKINALSAHNTELSRRLSLVAGELNKPLQNQG